MSRKTRGITKRKPRRRDQAGGPDIGPAQVIAGGGADVCSTGCRLRWQRAKKGVPLVNIAQPFKKSGMMLTCLKESASPRRQTSRKDARRLFFGTNIRSSLDEPARPANRWRAGGVTVLKQGFNVDPLIQKQAACISTMTYNEYWQVIDAGIKPEDLITYSNTKTRVSRRWKTVSTY